MKKDVVQWYKHIILYCSFNDNDISYVKNFRKKWAFLESSKIKKVKKKANKYVKASTMILDHMEGKSNTSYSKWNGELLEYIETILNLLYVYDILEESMLYGSELNFFLWLDRNPDFINYIEFKN